MAENDSAEHVANDASSARKSTRKSATKPAGKSTTKAAGKSTTKIVRKAKKRKSRQKSKSTTSKSAGKSARSGRGRTTPFPPVPFSSALSIAEAIQTHGAGQPMRRLTLFEKLDRSPESSASRVQIINSGRYGLTEGGYQADILSLTELGAIATSPESPPRRKIEARFQLAIEDIPAFKHLYDKNRGNRLPSPEVMRDSLAEAGVESEHRKQCVDIFLENLAFLGALRTIAGAERIIPKEQLFDEIGEPGTQDARTGRQEASTAVPDKTKKTWKSTCFVIAPIGEEGSEERRHSDMVLEALIRRALEPEGWEVLRADQIAAPGMITLQVIEHLHNAGLVVADLSFHNPNVLYELALRHKLGKPTVHLIRKGDAIPFDVKDFRTITINTADKYELVAKLETYRSEIANHVRQAASLGGSDSNPLGPYAEGREASAD